MVTLQEKFHGLVHSVCNLKQRTQNLPFCFHNLIRYDSQLRRELILKQSKNITVNRCMDENYFLFSLHVSVGD